MVELATHGVLSRSRGTNWFPQLFGWFMLLISPYGAMQEAGLFDPVAPHPVKYWFGLGIGLVGMVMGAGWALGRAGASVDPGRGEARQWWGVASWPVFSRTAPLTDFHAVRVHPKVVTQGGFPHDAWCVSLVRRERDAEGSDEFLLHHRPGRDEALAMAHELTQALHIPLQTPAAQPPE